MAKTVKVHYSGWPGTEAREVTFDEAKQIVEEVYSDPLGGLVFDSDTKEVIWELGSDVKRITIMDQIIGGG
jgi:hypothetical protein